MQFSRSSQYPNFARAKELMAAPIPEVDPPAADDTADPHTTTDHRLLRQPHDHCRGLCARRRTARPTALWRRDQDLMR
jgi:hypothetical protein